MTLAAPSFWQRDVLRLILALVAVSAGSAAAGAATGATNHSARFADGIELLFADGFESATLCAWSSSAPPSTSTWYLDADADMFGDPAVSTESCAAPPNHVANADDCDDASGATFPGAAPLDSPSGCLLDGDADDFGADNPPIGVVAGSDCDDGAAAVNTAATEICNAIDDDCDTVIDEGFDLDGDTYTTCGGDCNDADPDIHPGAFDDPDALFIDDNCDGIDGDVARAAFVAPAGVNGTGCTLAAPCLTIGHGAGVAAADPLRDQVFVQAGSYAEILAVPTGVAIVGGYDLLWQRADRTAAGHTATILGGYSATVDAWVTVRALSVTASFADLVLAGPTASSTGDSSIVVHSKLSTLQLDRVTFLQGDGADGATGTPGIGADPFAAPSGVDGLDGQEAVVICSTLRRPGGAGGGQTCGGSNRAGATGGAGGSMDTSCDGIGGTCSGSACNATAGLTGGTSPAGASGGAGGGTCASTAAVEGTPGAVLDGNAGTGQSARGFLESLNQWRGKSGTAGGLGNHGGGGGGGGGAGGCDTGTPEDRGPSGGGGGAGGCRAQTAGGGGSAGGGSFGIVAIQSTVVVRTSLFNRGAGGSGGPGGTGAAGQPGGDFGLGGNASPDTGPAGPGGAGGRGGHAGGGGGGAGGLSFGLFSFESALTNTGNSFVGGSPGPGGDGGLSPGTNDGGDGPAGTLGTTFTCASQSAC